MERSIKVLLGIIATSLVIANLQLAGVAFVSEAHAQWGECACKSEIDEVKSEIRLAEDACIRAGDETLQYEILKAVKAMPDRWGR